MENVLPQIFVGVIWDTRVEPVNLASSIQVVFTDHVSQLFNVTVRMVGRDEIATFPNAVRVVIQILDSVILLIHAFVSMVVVYKDLTVLSV